MRIAQYKQDFIQFMVRCGVLTFGDFVTKSGRRTPFFINTGNYDSGEHMLKLGRFYAEALTSALGTEFDCLFGPAYKGIPLVVTTGVALADIHGHDVGITFNRKEAKDHGEGGVLIGHKPLAGERIVIVEDVTTAGTSIRETIPALRAVADVDICALIVSVDRQERGSGDQSALAELQQEFGLRPVPIVTLDEIVSHLTTTKVDGHLVIDDEIHELINGYRARYGAVNTEAS